jgi:hypothetical protein
MDISPVINNKHLELAIATDNSIAIVALLQRVAT